jgi:hypothetical protein
MLDVSGIESRLGLEEELPPVFIDENMLRDAFKEVDGKTSRPKKKKKQSPSEEKG